MIVKITDSGFHRDRIQDFDSEGLNLMYYKHISFWYEFVTKKGYKGRLFSPKFLIHFFRVDNLDYEYLDSNEAQVWVDQVDPTPYLKRDYDDDGDLVYVNRYDETYFYKIRFKKNTWVKVDFEGLTIKQIAPSSITDPFNVNSFEIRPYHINDIQPIQMEEEIEIPDFLPFEL